MIITRSPLRVSLGGGGTDLPSYYGQHGGFLIARAIDKYVYVTIQPRFVDGFLLKYSQLEEVAAADEIRHPIFREAIRLVGVESRNLDHCPAPRATVSSLERVYYAVVVVNAFGWNSRRSNAHP